MSTTIAFRYLVAGVCILFLLGVSGCLNPFADSQSNVSSRPTGRIELSLTGADGSAVSASTTGTDTTLVPADSDRAIAQYTLFGTGPDEETVDETIDAAADRFTLAEIAAGTWTVTVSGVNADGVVIVTGAIEIEVTAGGETAASVALTRATGTGTANIGVTLPDDTPTGTVTARRDGGTETALTVTDGQATYQAEIESGSYTLMITVTDQNGEVIGTAVRALQVFAGLTTTGEISFEDTTLLSHYTVTFDSQGGSGVDPQSVRHAGIAAEPTPPVREGYGLSGWYTHSTDGVAWDFLTDTITSDLTLYAQWEINEYTITFDSAGGTAVDPITQDFGTEITAPGEPTREESTFIGWIPELPETIPAEDLTVTAQWDINEYTITFDTDGGTTVDPITQDFGTEITAPDDPEREGFTFEGWNPAVPAVMLEGGAALTAAWTANTYTVTLNAQGGSGGTGIVNATFGGPMPDGLVAPTRLGYSFAGYWCEDDGGGTQYYTSGMESANDWNIADATTLYAHWDIDYSTMISVPGGTFSQEDLGGNSFQHTISNFEISKYQVTYELWYTVRQWALGNGYAFANPGREGSSGTTGGVPSAGGKHEPVTTVNWRDTIVWLNAYSKMAGLTPVYYTDEARTTPIKDSNAPNAHWRTPGSIDNPYVDWEADGYRLPTEGEWQYAAGYQDGTNWTPPNYASGAWADLSIAAATGAVAWYNANSFGKTQTVGTRTANQLGIHDMSGNVFEWAWDWRVNYPAGPATDYRGPSIGSARVFRGGSWFYASNVMLVGSRNSGSPWFSDFNFGFRSARTVP